MSSDPLTSFSWPLFMCRPHHAWERGSRTGTRERRAQYSLSKPNDRRSPPAACLPAYRSPPGPGRTAVPFRDEINRGCNEDGRGAARSLLPFLSTEPYGTLAGVSILSPAAVPASSSACSCIPDRQTERASTWARVRLNSRARARIASRGAISG